MKFFRERNWTKFWLHFAFGIIVGVVVGFGFFAQSEYASSTSDSNTPLIVIISLTSLSLGLLGGIYGDELWAQIYKLF